MLMTQVRLIRPVGELTRGMYTMATANIPQKVHTPFARNVLQSIRRRSCEKE